MTTVGPAAQCRRPAPTSGHQRNYRAQAVIPANNRRRPGRTSRQAPAKVTVASHGRMNNQLCPASPPSNGAKAQRAGRRFRRDVRQLGAAHLLPTSACRRQPLAIRRHTAWSAFWLRTAPRAADLACVCPSAVLRETQNMAFCAGRTTAHGGDGAAFSLAARLGSLCAEGAQSRSCALLVRRVSG